MHNDKAGLITGMQRGCNIRKPINTVHINTFKKKNQIMAGIHTEKAVDKIQQPFLIKTLKKLEMYGYFFNFTKHIPHFKSQHS